MLRLALLDDHPAVLAGLAGLIGERPDLRVVAAARSPEELALRLGGVRPDVLVLDHEQALALCLRIKNRPHAPAVVLYTAAATPELVLAARAAQADALVDKAAPIEDLVTAIRRTAAGEDTFPEVPREVYAAAVSRLHDADLPVLAMLLEREPLASIADTLRERPEAISWRARRITGLLRVAPVRTP